MKDIFGGILFYNLSNHLSENECEYGKNSK